MGMIDLVEKGYIPDFLTRIGIRRLCAQRLKKERNNFRHDDALTNLMAAMSSSPLALNTSEANDQHYEVPTRIL